MATSGSPRSGPTFPYTRFWKVGRWNTVDTPPPPAAGSPNSDVSFQTLSGAVRLPLLSRCSWVPPTEVTSGSLDGQLSTRYVYQLVAPSVGSYAESSVAPPSPDALSTVT